MSLFQCSKCGCRENTALSSGAHAYANNHLYQNADEALASYKEILGLSPQDDFGAYCSTCSPFWFTAKGNLGVGANPCPTPGKGEWHGRFPREFYPVGTMRTDHEGNLEKIR